MTNPVNEPLLGYVLECCGCGTNVIARPALGTEIYPHRADLAHKKFWLCDGCGNYVGSHKGSGEPLGCIPTPEIRKARSAIHARLDPLWQSGRFSRTALYAAISKELGWEYHTAHVSTLQQARTVREIILQIAISGVTQCTKKSK